MRRRGAGCAGRSREPVTGGECGGQFVGSAARFGAVFFLNTEYVAGGLFFRAVGTEQVGDELLEIAHREAEFTGSGFRLFGAFQQVSVGKSGHVSSIKKAFLQGKAGLMSMKKGRKGAPHRHFREIFFFGQPDRPFFCFIFIHLRL